MEVCHGRQQGRTTYILDSSAKAAKPQKNGVRNHYAKYVF